MIVNILILIGVAAALGFYVWTAPPLLETQTVGDHKEGAGRLKLRSVRAFEKPINLADRLRNFTFGNGGTKGGETEGEAFLLVPSTNSANSGNILKNGMSAPFVSVNSKQNLLLLDVEKAALQFSIDADNPATAVNADDAELVVQIEPDAKLRRFPRIDSRVLGTPNPNSSGQYTVMREIWNKDKGDWVQVELSNPDAGWVLADSAHSTNEKGLVKEATFRKRAPIRKEPYPQESLIVWEGAVTDKTIEDDTYKVIVGSHEAKMDKESWEAYSNGDYVAYRKGETEDEEDKGLTIINRPVGYTRTGSPYEVAKSYGDSMQIYYRERGQAWVKRESCANFLPDFKDAPEPTMRSKLGDKLRALFGRR